MMRRKGNGGFWKKIYRFQKNYQQQQRPFGAAGLRPEHESASTSPDDVRGETTFNKILIANRGEIACRIINTARRMGIKTVAVYSVADVHSKHVRLADEAVFLGPSPAIQSYLNTAKILEAIRKTGADAVHPGYGFLSENASFAKMLETEQITFIGPPATVISQMGDKLESKRMAMQAGINVIPGYDGIVHNAEHCVEIARRIGYPVMIKASAGGGGKGMRIARTDGEAREGFRLSTEEARSSFGDGRMLVEKYIDQPRHIEIQVLADQHGHAIYLPERECSIQRRNQKVIEEAPSTFLDASTRRFMGEQAVRLCQKLGYSSAGTVEFLLDEHRNFYFLEMNTRLQVEHPVTELITGIDLVQQMIRIANWNRLTIQQSDVMVNGWAVECRVYAEDPYKNFGLPNIGRLYKYMEPSKKPGIRCDSGIEEGSEISIYYDSLISKLICHGRNRQEAIDRSVAALDSYVIRGVTHNIPLLRCILTGRQFVSGDFNTNYLNQVYSNGFRGHQLSEQHRQHLFVVAASLYAVNELRNRQFIEKESQRFSVGITIDGQTFYNADIVTDDKRFIKISVNNRIFSVDKSDMSLGSDLIETKIDGVAVTMQLVSRNANGQFQIIYQGTTYKLNILPKQAANLLYLMPEKPKLDVSKLIKSPMPGLIKCVSCLVGDEVAEGQELCTIEAMKMQNSLCASQQARIKSVHVREGDTIGEGDILIEFD